MSSVTRNRLGAVCGLLSVLVTLIGLFIHGYPDIGASPRQIARWAVTTNQQQFAVGIYIEGIGTLFFLLFAAWLWSIARDAEGGSGWLSTAGFANAVLYAAPVLNGIWWAVLDAGRRGATPQTLAAVRDVAQHGFDLSLLCFGAFLVLIGGVLVLTRALPRWIGVPAVVIGVGSMIPQTDQDFVLLFFVWSLVVSIYVLFRPGAAAVADGSRARLVPGAAAAR